MVKKALVFCILTLIIPFKSGFIFAQNAPSELMREVRTLAIRNAVGELGYNDIEGNPHYSDEFLDGTVFLKNGNSYTLPLRYDLFQDEIEFKKDEKVFWLLKSDVLYIKYGEEIIVPESSSEESEKSTYFFEEEKGKYSLYIRKKVSFSPKVPPKGYADAIPDRFVRDVDEYYLKQEGKPALEIRNKKVLSEILSENKPALDFIKKSRTKANKLEDLRELVKFLNE